MREFLKSLIIALYSVINKNVRGKVIYYHDVYDNVKYTEMGTPIALFKKHVSVLYNNGFRIVNRMPVNDYEVNVCFDDGWLGLWDTRDYFISNNILPTIFISPNKVGESGYLSWEQIAFLKDNGFNFQSHTLNHVKLTDVDESILINELVDSKTIIEEHLGIDVDSICYPCGNYSQKVLDESLKAGYNKLYVSVPGAYMGGGNVIYRNLVQDSTPFRFKCILFGGLNVLKQRTQKHHFIN